MTDSANSGGRGRRRVLVVGVAGVVGLVLAVWGVATLASPSTGDDAAVQFAFLADDPDPAPAGLDLGQLGNGSVDADAVHLLGAFEGRDIYFGTGAADIACLIIYEPASASSASSCRLREGLGEAPLGVSIRGGVGGGIEVYLVPDDATVASLPDGWEQVSPNVLAIEMATETAGELTVEMPSGQSFTLHRQG